MFDKIEYKLLFSSCITKDEYKQLIKKYMDEFNIPYITAKQYITLQKNRRI
jgi:2-oxo-4-hydroxy-4-carboxy--5-ureidoimidazoline (OHCU) decarboxylase